MKRRRSNGMLTTDRRLYYRWLRRNMILIVILVSVTPLLAVSGIILKEFHQSYQEKVHAHLKELVQKHKQNIDAFLSERLGDIRFIATAFDFQQLSNEIFLQEKLKSLQREFGPVFEDLGVVTEDGLQVNYAGPFKLGKALYSEAEWFRRSIVSHYFISDVFLGLRGLPHFIVAVRQDWQGSPWILRATIDFMAFNSLVENLRIGNTGFAFIVNKQGAFQTKPRFDAIPDRAAFKYFTNDTHLGADTVHIVEREDSGGNRNIYAAAFLKNGDWLMICQQSRADAYSDLEHTWKIALAGLMAGGLAIIVTAFVLANRTIHKLAESDREKELMNQQVIETGKLASIGELAAGIAHEINNPVAIMVEEAGWVQDLLEDEEFQDSGNLEEFHRSLQQIKTQGRRCKEITHKLLSFARKTDSTVQEVPLNALIEEVVGVSVQRAKYSNVVIRTHFNEQEPIVEASRTEMQQVFLNLINNALDAMDPKGGAIDITTRVIGNTVEIDVADNGPGIPDSYLPKIFDPFFTTKPVGKGTGLGLSICYGIIKKLGGDVTAESVIEKGTTFHVRMPVATWQVEHLSSDRSERAA